MSLDQCIKKIDRYLSKNEGLPLIVDVQNNEDLKELVQHYNVGKNILITASQYCAHDELPRFDSLLDDLAQKESVMIVTEASLYLKLAGEQELQQFMRQLINMYIKGHVIFITYQCRRYLPVSDTREGRRVIVVDGDECKVPNIIFTAPGINLPKDVESINGINNFAKVTEKVKVKNLYVITCKNKKTFPKALYQLSSLENSYDALVIKDSTTSTLPRSLGSDAQWNYALKLFESKLNWADVIDTDFGAHTMLEHVFSNYRNFTPNRKWLYLVGLKLFGAKGNWCLTTAAQMANSVDDFTRQVYRCLLDKSVAEKNFWECYESRKTVLRQLENTSSELSAYCKLVFSKEDDTIYYLTDITQKEQETIFEFLDKYGQKLDRVKLIKLLKKVYPALYSYLLPYQFGNELLDSYFQDYKYQKVINKILPEFKDLVEEQAEKREYNYIPPRSSVIENLDRREAQLYFMDAMGVEYLSYILAVCKDLDLLTNIKVCVAELPSITSCNKEFLDLFVNTARPTVSIKELDDIKHHGKYDYDFYNNSKLPIHLIKELEVIRNVLVKIKEDLLCGKIKRAFMIADHGASRLAVLNDTENIWEMSEKGQHSGRCCLKSDVDEKPVFAADAGDFWALANYDRFKGSRKANVEVHGGATLEELCVPVIEFSYLAEKPEIILMAIDKSDATIDGAPVIEVSFRKKAALKLFSTVYLQNVSVIVNDKRYFATELGNNYYRIDMPELKKQDTYYADVCIGDNVIAEQLPFIIRKEGQHERTLL